MSEHAAAERTAPDDAGRRGAVVLAAGKGTRFRSERAKVLHRVAGRTMLRWVLEALRPLGLDRVVVVVGHQADEVRAEAEASGLPGLVTVLQSEQRGTGHAVRCAVDDGALEGIDRVIVLPGDVPLLSARTLEPVLDAGDPAATVLTFDAADPAGYGRVLRDADGRVTRIVEHGDATDDERLVTEVNTAIYAFDARRLASELAALSSANAQGEEYLTDVIAPLVPHGVGAALAPEDEVAGINDRVQLADAGAVLRRRILERVMREGATVVDPQTTYVEADVTVGRDALLRPGTHLEGATRIADGAEVGPDTRLVDTRVEEGAVVAYSVASGANIGPGASVGPYAHLRSGTRLAAGAKVGEFVGTKSSVIGARSKVPHLAYIGDAEIGEDVNIGAATVTVNYDGFEKNRTVIGDRARVGSDTMLVAPVRIGVEAYTGAGSVITTDVPDGALGVERTEQRIIDGFAERKRAKHDRRQATAGGTSHGAGHRDGQDGSAPEEGPA
ncbi:UDP-N-acetylglucosamine diphosphorylase/glucosamine-1-phosphate N-acetyltransferase [Egibacter rhizosphaerae]|uniref:Bifunctional protein GlmU n=1 Tax=Egibacter rhizosphaerae TaxID=1670831 RepID=A0A411YIT5_9ACTN|nr:bifunctional UDP-N-acetylglucosamine diphosphorylase/glucosamine-1-phosphate N-acetyltransferase GlmU [Egibacter rhizosphaerae]QBI21107.1 UDP-N-acetylglucosamine diphosphorylase/glucosamine-1-phosphate N-acetyltransferase [Egibacter rhizosphaerae]